MKILNIEDTATKHAAICKVLRKAGITDMDWAKNLEDGLELLREHAMDYDLVITDMYYPLKPGDEPAEAGELLMDKMKELQLSIPIIVCSSIRYSYGNILGNVFYSETCDWESQLLDLVKKL